MDLKEIADGLSAKFNLSGLTIEDGELALEIDGMPILLGDAGGEAILMTGFIGEAPSEGGEAFANLLLEATTALMDTKSAALARNPETGAYMLVQRLVQDRLALDAFCDELTAFVNAKIAERAEAKKAKDFAKADAIRAELLEKGIQIKDTREGVVWEKI